MAKSAVVVVDDDAPIAQLVSDVLAEEGLRARVCTHGPDAYPAIQHERPYLVILDLQMPLVDGIHVFHQLRADPATATVPVIFLTANPHILEQRLPTYRDMRAQLVRKPFDLDDFIQALTQALH